MIFTVAIDGPAAAGKGTIAKAVAASFGFGHLDSGLLYRAVGAKHLTGVEPAAAARQLKPGDLDGETLRTPQIAQAASMVAQIPEVRTILKEFQQSFARRQGGAVIDGRDIGTVICPEAEVKLFVTASADVRARRRYEELTQKGHDTSFETVLADVEARDARDRDRSVAPLIPAKDAVILDTSDLAVEAAVEAATAYIRVRLP